MSVESVEQDLAREELAIAPISKRVKAFIADESLIAGIMIAALPYKFDNLEETIALIAAVNSVLVWVIAIRFVYHLIFVSIYGATLGKIWQGITIISIDTLGKPSPFAAFSRSAVRIVSDACFAYGFLWAFFNPFCQTWHDKISGTIVVDA